MKHQSHSFEEKQSETRCRREKIHHPPVMKYFFLGGGPAQGGACPPILRFGGPALAKGGAARPFFPAPIFTVVMFVNFYIHNGAANENFVVVPSKMTDFL